MFLSLLIILIIVLVAGAFFLAPDNPDDGSPALLQGLAQIRNMTRDSDEDRGESATIYKWQDAAGEWHFSNTPPPAGVASQVKTYRTDINVIRSTRPPPADRPVASPESPVAASSDRGMPGLPSPKGIKQLMDDARAVDDLSRDRRKNLDQQIDANQ